MSQVTYWNASVLRMCMRRVTCVWAVSHTNKASHLWVSHGSCCNSSRRVGSQIRRCLMAHMWMSHVSHLNESCRICKCVMSHVCMCCVTGVWAMSQTNKASHRWMSHGLCCNSSRRAGSWIRRWFMSHMFMRHITHANESCHICECVMPHVCMQRVTCVWVVLRTNKASHLLMSHGAIATARDVRVVG